MIFCFCFTFRLTEHIFPKRKTVKPKQLLSPVLCKWASVAFLGIFAIILLIVLPAACVHYGRLGQAECPLEPNVPIWLIVLGITTIVSTLICVALLITGLCIGCRIYRRNEKKRAMGKNSEKLDDPRTVLDGFLIVLVLVILLYLLFVVGWIGIGNIWVFSIFIEFFFGEGPTCTTSTYLFAFFLLIALDGFIFLAVFFTLLGFIVITYFITKYYWENFAEQDTAPTQNRKTFLGTPPEQ